MPKYGVAIKTLYEINRTIRDHEFETSSTLLRAFVRYNHHYTRTVFFVIS